MACFILHCFALMSFVYSVEKEAPQKVLEEKSSLPVADFFQVMLKMIPTGTYMKQIAVISDGHSALVPLKMSPVSGFIKHNYPPD